MRVLGRADRRLGHLFSPWTWPNAPTIGVVGAVRSTNKSRNRAMSVPESAVAEYKVVLASPPSQSRHSQRLSVGSLPRPDGWPAWAASQTPLTSTGPPWTQRGCIPRRAPFPPGGSPVGRRTRRRARVVLGRPIRGLCPNSGAAARAVGLPAPALNRLPGPWTPSPVGVALVARSRICFPCSPRFAGMSGTPVRRNPGGVTGSGRRGCPSSRDRAHHDPTEVRAMVPVVLHGGRTASRPSAVPRFSRPLVEASPGAVQ